MTTSSTALPTTPAEIYAQAEADLMQGRRLQEEWLVFHVALAHPLTKVTLDPVKDQGAFEAHSERFYDATHEIFNAIYEALDKAISRKALPTRFEIDAFEIEDEKWTLCENDGEVEIINGQFAQSYSFHSHQACEPSSLNDMRQAIETALTATGNEASIVQFRRMREYAYSTTETLPLPAPVAPAKPKTRRKRPARTGL